MDHIQRALALAERALGSVSPNPAVGAVLVRGGEVVGEGFTQPPGGPHAEIVALRQAGEKARGSTLYVTLEPCCHFGRTPPCTAAIIEAGVAEVRFSLLDLNPKVSGRGKGELEAAGVRTVVGEGAERAAEINEAYLKHVQTGLPFVAAKYAMSLDGKIATRTGDSRWITGEEARRWAHHLRSQADAIMVGVGTVLSDDPRLTARDAWETPAAPRQPLRVVVDSQGRTSPKAAIFHQPGRSLVAVASDAARKPFQQIGEGVDAVAFPGEDGHVDILSLLRYLGSREVTSVLVEGGGTLLGSLMDAALIDKVYAFVAPVLVGGREASSPFEGAGVARMAEALRLQRVRVETLGPDILVSGYVHLPMVAKDDLDRA
ncbi:MAG: bifunctional diaminohydroxyphosphoribosylaminopyrimidine deaminase/5-amino-6-(5-phosphoribosylamino)uracil reductase RibD [Chloroflexi bacterium]|nr:bifunctional diaminohydroxyphosphoribosylaminopyrimidine deaminase/5-amino-6-(5-phosphoribosylamino)uracil reductase RibD [Chloroflexota bacterium]